MKFLFAALTLVLSFNVMAQGVSSENAGTPGAQVQININDAKAKKSLLAFPPLQFVGIVSANKGYDAVGAELFRVIFNDLSVSGYFQFISQNAFLEDTTKTGLRPKPTEANGFSFDSWKQIGSDFLIRGAFSLSGNDLTFEVYAYSVSRGTLVVGKKYKGTKNAARRIAHTFSNDFLDALTGKKGMYLSRVVVSSDRGGGKFKEIYLMDWDGVNVEKVTNHKSVAISPAWSPDATKIAYTAFVKRAKSGSRNADMFLYDIGSGKRELLSYRQGINSGAAFSPDGRSLYLTLSQGGNPDIYQVSLTGDILKRITNGPRGSMNVEPAPSPDGSKIAFSSDRSGNPMVFVMGADGSNVQRRTIAGKYNATPAWSPDGKKIAFAGWESDHFDVFVMDADGSNMIRITSAKKPSGKWARNEDPVFSPDGRLLMYTSDRTGANQVYISNLDGSEERRITNDSFNYFKPKWSKNIE